MLLSNFKDANRQPRQKPHTAQLIGEDGLVASALDVRVTTVAATLAVILLIGPCQALHTATP